MACSPDEENEQHKWLKGASASLRSTTRGKMLRRVSVPSEDLKQHVESDKDLEDGDQQHENITLSYQGTRLKHSKSTVDRTLSATSETDSWASTTAEDLDENSPKTLQIVELPDGDKRTSPEFFVKKFWSVLEDCSEDLPLLAISITGVLRSGKSFLLNLLITYLEYVQEKGHDEDWETSERPVKGVSWAAGRASVTHGIWMWHKPFNITRKDGTRIVVVLLDIQGLGDTIKGDSTIDNLILYIGLQICNVTILNMQKQLTHNDLTTVKMCTKYAAINDAKDKVFGSLVFLARDYTLSEELGEQPNSFDEIRQKTKSSDVVASANGILKAFEDITCFHLPPPGSRVIASTANEYSTSLTVLGEDIGESFLEHSKALFQRILSVPAQTTVGNARLEFLELEVRIDGHEHAMLDPEDGMIDCMAYNAFKRAVDTFESQSSEKVKDYDTSPGIAAAGLVSTIEGLGKQAMEKFASQCVFAKDQRGKKFYRKYEQMLKKQISDTVTAAKLHTLEKDNRRIEDESKQREGLLRKEMEAEIDQKLADALHETTKHMRMLVVQHETETKGYRNEISEFEKMQAQKPVRKPVRKPKPPKPLPKPKPENMKALKVVDTIRAKYKKENRIKRWLRKTFDKEYTKAIEAALFSDKLDAMIKSL